MSQSQPGVEERGEQLGQRDVPCTRPATDAVAEALRGPGGVAVARMELGRLTRRIPRERSDEARMDADVREVAARLQHACGFAADGGEFGDIGVEERAGDAVERGVGEGEDGRIGLEQLDAAFGARCRARRSWSAERSMPVTAQPASVRRRRLMPVPQANSKQRPDPGPSSSSSSRPAASAKGPMWASYQSAKPS